VLRLRQQVTPQEIQQADEDLNLWQSEIAQLDAELKTKEKKREQVPDALPPVRGTKREKLEISSKKSSSSSSGATTTPGTAGGSQRLSGYDFQSWEKFDVDAAVNAIDDEEEKSQRERQQSKETGKRLAEEVRAKRAQRYQEELLKIRNEMKTFSMSDVQRKSMAGLDSI
jgi:RNA polymerase II-associated protein 3